VNVISINAHVPRPGLRLEEQVVLELLGEGVGPLHELRRLQPNEAAELSLQRRLDFMLQVVVEHHLRDAPGQDLARDQQVANIQL